MILRYLHDEKLAQASYLLGCAATGDALVVDPHRDVRAYTELAAREGLRITHVTETHIHADFVSGVRELAAATGARVLLSGEGGDDWKYGFADADGAELLNGGDEFMVGNIRVRVEHTPGHTPEHLSFIVTDTAGADRPMGVFTGDFIFVGDVGRPDLLEKAAGVAGATREGARQLFRSLERFRDLPDWLQIWPGHGAGSACGKALGAVPSTTLGYEKLFNWAFSLTGEDEFVEAVVAGQPDPPAYFARMKHINRDGPPVLGHRDLPERLPPADLARVLEAGGTVVDIRPWRTYREGHVPGTVNIPLNRSFSTWAASLIPYDREFHLIIGEDDGRVLAEVLHDLAMVGLDRLAGYFDEDAVRAYGALETAGEVTVDELRRMRDAGEVTIVDVRRPAEWRAGHLPGVPNIPLDELAGRMGDVPDGGTLVVHCRSGGRSAIAASVLAAHGRTPVLSLAGGIEAWNQTESDGDSDRGNG